MLSLLFCRFPISRTGYYTQTFLPWSFNDFCSCNNPFNGYPLLALYVMECSRHRMKRTKLASSSYASQFLTNELFSSLDFRSVHLWLGTPSRVFHYVNSAFLSFFVADTLRNIDCNWTDNEKATLTTINKTIHKNNMLTTYLNCKWICHSYASWEKKASMVITDY